MRALFVAIVFVFCGVATAHAQIDTETFVLPADGDGFLGIQGTAVPGHLQWNSTLSVNFSYATVVPVNSLDGTRFPPLVEDRLLADSGLQLGLTDRLAVGLAAPVLLWQTGTPLPGTQPLANNALGDPRLFARVRLLGDSADAHRDRREGPGLALQGTVWLPGTETNTLFSEYDLRAELDALADFHILGAGIGVMIGARYRGVPRTFLDQRFTSSVFLGIALEIPIPVTRGFSGLAEVRASTDTTYVFAGYATNVEVNVGPRLRLADFVLTASVGFGLAAGVGSPVVRGVVETVFAPRVHDQDADGIPDDRDQCPPLAEDHDGYEDADGCPDPDNDDDLVPDADDHCPNVGAVEGQDDDEDGCTDADADSDGVPDARDSCPAEAEDRDEFHDDDGCPDPDDDEDHVLDAQDHCPHDAEDRDGFEDADGCPELDNDHDGVPDTTDACPNEPETMDGVYDEDGCPDASTDHDHDGIADAADHCPDQPETVNGVTDTDGCPDTGGRALWRADATGVLTGTLRPDAHGALPTTQTAALEQLALLVRAHAPVVVHIAADATWAAALSAALAARGVAATQVTVALDGPARSTQVRVTPPAAAVPAPAAAAAPPQH